MVDITQSMEGLDRTKKAQKGKIYSLLELGHPSPFALLTSGDPGSQAFTLRLGLTPLALLVHRPLVLN